ncbi:glycosyltransferase family 1 protein [Pedobacter aquatilis]|uniref:glycosyltransferase family 4 protein n=1 Tax=Pedobacter aquatilis TaxID=351343 RepID=UPI00292D0AF4|nr:glycosyltransferase family 1 protein [Pedobacter aquatilis]
MRVGILLENYKKEEGGSHSYYNTLVEGIADYNFSDNLEFAFVALGDSLDKSAPDNSFLLDIEKIMRSNNKFLFWINKLASIKGISYFPLSDKIQFSYTKRFNEELKAKLIENKIDVLYALTPFYKDLNFPTIVTHWDIGHKSSFMLPEVTFDGEYEMREMYYDRYLQKAFAIFCESEAGKNELCHYKQINPERVFVIPMFAGNITKLVIDGDTEKQVLDKFNIKTNKFFLYPAQFWSHKNHYSLIMAFQKFQKESPEVKLLLPGGDKGNLKYIKQLVNDLNLNDNIIFGGFVTNQELNVFYKNAISLVMPTVIGPTNMPPLEAKALNCQVICTDMPGHRETLGDYAIYINPYDVDNIFAALNSTFDNIADKKNTEHNSSTLLNSLAKIEEAFTKLVSIRKLFGTDFRIE